MIRPLCQHNKMLRYLAEASAFAWQVSCIWNNTYQAFLCLNTLRTLVQTVGCHLTELDSTNQRSTMFLQPLVISQTAAYFSLHCRTKQ